MNATQEPVLGAWPQDGLVAVPQCPACGSSHRRLLHPEMTDRVFGIAPGTWTLVGCRDCGSAWLDPRPSAETLPLAYAAYFTHATGARRTLVRRRGVFRRILHDAANDYMNSRYGSRLAPARAGALIRLIPGLRAACDSMCRHLPPPSGGRRLLDVGCGNGLFLSLANDMGWDAQGVDFDAAAVDSCRRQGLRATHGSVEDLRDLRGSFDVVTSSHVIEHVPDPLTHLAAVRSMLRPGGMMWLQTPNIDSVGSRRYGRDWRDLDPPRHLVLYNHASLQQCLERSGFRNVQVRSDAMQVSDIFRGSEAVRRRRPVHLSGVDRSRLPLELAVEVFEWFFPRRREFITVTCTT